MTKKRALISLFDKTGAVEFARGLCKLDYEIISTGGTAALFRENGIPVTDVSEITGFPECLDGRVKTLHPAVHAGLLAVRSNPAHMKTLEEQGLGTIDIVAVNLYPFRQTILREGVSRGEAIENIDIGGPSMLRSAAENHRDVAGIVDPADYNSVLGELGQTGAVSDGTRLALAAKAFGYTSAYDTLIAAYLRDEAGASIFPDKLTLTYEKIQEMRYGENPGQTAAFYREVGLTERGDGLSGTLLAAGQLHGKELSYCNINDANGAIEAVKEFDEPCVVAVKHATPCGIGTADNIREAFVRAYEADPVSIFGGIIAFNREVDAETAEVMKKVTPLDILIAPSYTEDALRILRTRKYTRILELPEISKPNTRAMLDMKKVLGGLLVQEPNIGILNGSELNFVTEKRPTEEQMRDLIFAMKAVKHTKSNAIVLAKNGATTGIGGGQVNRIWPFESAIKQAGDRARGSAAASDAFFPMPDCVEAAASAGITAIIQPGGSLRDQDSIDAANRLGVAMVFTGRRHFRH